MTHDQKLSLLSCVLGYSIAAMLIFTVELLDWLKSKKS